MTHVLNQRESHLKIPVTIPTREFSELGDIGRELYGMRTNENGGDKSVEPQILLGEWPRNLRNPEPRPSTRGVLSGYGGRPSQPKAGRVSHRTARRSPAQPSAASRALADPRQRGVFTPPK